MYKLYVFVRSDLESLNSGRLGAQTAHAASQCAEYHLIMPFGSYSRDSYEEWSKDYGFGTSIVLDGGSFECEPFNMDYDFAGKSWSFYNNGVEFHMIHDPTYPLKDGKVMHYLSINTCYWVFGDPELDDKLKEYLARFKLYNGNHD